MCLVDLHLRTTASDGTLSRHAVFKYVRRLHIALFSITDRDLPQWIDVPADLSDNYLPGISVHAQIDDRPLDLLIYGNIDPRTKLVAELAVQRIERSARVRETIFRLIQTGIVITFDEVLRHAGPECSSITRFHIAKVLVERGIARTVRDAFRRYLSCGSPCYVPFSRLDAQAVVEMAHDAGAIAVVADPLGLTNNLDIERLARLGIDGIETRQTTMPPEQSERLEQYARMHALLITGGSHCQDRGVPGPVPLPEASLNLLRRYAFRLAG